MMNFFKKINNQEKEDPQLISIHIPKTAGTSFVTILKNVYGHSNIGTLHLPQEEVLKDPIIYYQDQLINKADLSINRDVIHGHFYHNKIAAVIKPPANTPVITWLRNPIDRVVSSYHYANNIYKNELSEIHPRLNILNSLKRDLMEYAHSKENRNICSKFLDGAKLEELKFVGIVEHFEEDMAYLAKLLGWKDYKLHHLNRTSKYPALPDLKKDTIGQWNQKDLELYQHALELRKKRI